MKAQSALVVTQNDKILSHTDRIRLLKRLHHEAGGDFAKILPVSLLQAMENEIEQFEASGAIELVEFIFGLEDLRPNKSSGRAEPAPSVQNEFPAAPQMRETVDPQSTQVCGASAAPDTLAHLSQPQDEGAYNPTYPPQAGHVLDDQDDQTRGRVVPRRVKPVAKSTRLRLSRSSEAALAAAVANMDI